MVDSELVGVGGEVAAGVADLPVVPEAGGEGEQAHPDAGAEAGQGAGAVAFEPELALAGPEDRFDALADVPERAEAGLLVAPVGAQQARSLRGDEALEVVAGEALVGDDRVTGQRHPFEQLLGDLTLGGVGGRELEADRGAVAGAEQVEPKAPDARAARSQADARRQRRDISVAESPRRAARDVAGLELRYHLPQHV